MVFKLIRVDIEEPSKIQLQVGKHIIGRGKFLHNDDNDKRVSRNHAELEVTDDSVKLKALHQNPCFYIKTNTIDTEILQQSNEISLGNGDKFGLIPDNFWYEVIHCSEPDIPQNTTVCGNENNKSENGVEKSEKEIESNEEKNATSNTNVEDEAIDFQMSEELESSNRSTSPSLLNAEESTQPNENTQTYDPTPSTPNKRAHNSCDSSPVDVKKVKTEPPTPDGQDQPGPSNDQPADPNSTDQKPNIAALVTPPQAPATPKRERCMYGASCYRRNPQHKAQFSHPSDSDWGTGARGVCPYGSSCRKIDPRHWQSHEHPPGVNPPNPAARRPGQRRNQNRTTGSDNEDSSRVKRRINKSSESDYESGDSSETNLIVTGKRVRKTVSRDAWFDTQSDEDEDPYKTDESEEWQPSSDITNSEGL